MTKRGKTEKDRERYLCPISFMDDKYGSLNKQFFLLIPLDFDFG